MVQAHNRLRAKYTGRFRARIGRWRRVILQVELRIDVLPPWPPPRERGPNFEFDPLSTYTEWRDAVADDITSLAVFTKGEVNVVLTPAVD